MRTNKEEMMKKGVGWHENITVLRGYIKMGAK
jgi:hypothetical protein